MSREGRMGKLYENKDGEGRMDKLYENKDGEGRMDKLYENKDGEGRMDKLYENIDTMDPNLPIIFHRDTLGDPVGKVLFGLHWHEKIEFLYFTAGEAVIKCNTLEFAVKAGDLIIINSNELHQGRAVTDDAEYFCIIVDAILFQSRFVDVCETKYINPISQNRLVIKNLVRDDGVAAGYIQEFVREYEAGKIGYEMAVKAYLYQLLVHLLRNHVRNFLSSREYGARMRNLKRFNVIFLYIEKHYNTT